MKQTVFIFRHGETDWNRDRRLQGQSDIPLNETGRSQAAELARKMQEHALDLIISSDLVRAADTARAVARWTRSPIVFSPHLRETNLGEAEGLTFTEAEKHLGPEAIQMWMSVEPQHSDYAFPGGESKRAHQMRLFHVLEWALDLFPALRIGISTHGGAMRRILHHVRPDLKEPVLFQNCGVYKFEFDRTTRMWSVDLQSC